MVGRPVLIHGGPSCGPCRELLQVAARAGPSGIAVAEEGTPEALSTLTAFVVRLQVVASAGPFGTTMPQGEGSARLSGRVAVLQVVAGAGPSGIAVAERVAKAGYRVCVVDPAPQAHWPNNYGVWVDEFDAMGLGDCLEIVWPRAKVHLDSRKEDER